VVLDLDVRKARLVEALTVVLRGRGEGKRDAVDDELSNLLERPADDRPAIDVGRLGPPSLGLLVIEDAYGHDLRVA
jgi:hypothetical protein